MVSGLESPYDNEKAISDPRGPIQGVFRELRGGSFHLFSLYARSAYRIDADSAVRDSNLGFRPARTYP